MNKIGEWRQDSRRALVLVADSGARVAQVMHKVSRVHDGWSWDAWVLEPAPAWAASRVFKATEEQALRSPHLAGASAMGWTEEHVIAELWRALDASQKNCFRLAETTAIPTRQIEVAKDGEEHAEDCAIGEAVEEAKRVLA